MCSWYKCGKATKQIGNKCIFLQPDHLGQISLCTAVERFGIKTKASSDLVIESVFELPSQLLTCPVCSAGFDYRPPHHFEPYNEHHHQHVMRSRHTRHHYAPYTHHRPSQYDRHGRYYWGSSSQTWSIPLIVLFTQVSSALQCCVSQQSSIQQACNQEEALTPKLLSSHISFNSVNALRHTYICPFSSKLVLLFVWIFSFWVCSLAPNRF